MELKLEQKYLIVSSKIYQSKIYSYKKNNPFLDIQLITKEELLDMVAFSFDKDPIPYLLKKEKYDYSQCKKLLNILRVGDIKKNPDFLSLYNELNEQGYIRFDDLATVKLKQRKLMLLESMEDMELHQLLNRIGISYEDVSLSDFGFKPVYSEANGPEIKEFESKSIQYMYLFSDIRKRIIQDPSCKEKITVLVKDQQDIFYINYFSSMFDIDVFFQLKTPLVSDRDVAYFIAKIYQEKRFDVLDTNNASKALLQLDKIIHDYELASLPFVFAYSCLMEIISSQSISYRYSNKGITFRSDLFFAKEDEIIYVTDFQHDDFYKEFDDNNLLPDDQLENLGVNPSYVKTKLDRREKLNFICYHSFAFLSRVLLHLKDKIYSSQFIEEMNWKSHKEKGFNLNGLYTSKAEVFLRSYQKDLQKDKPDQFYKSYDHKYHKISRVDETQKYSASKLDKYYKCPFYYYLENVLSLSKYDTDNDKLAIYRGQLIHSVVEDVYSRNYFPFESSYDEAFNRGLTDCLQNAKKDGYEFTVEELASFEFVKFWLKDVIKAVNGQKDFANIDGEKAEEEINFNIGDYRFTGYIDKIVYTKGKSGQQYYNIIDYKSGTSGSFDLTKCYFGGSLQLPLYYLGIRQKENEHLTHNSTDQFGGFGIQHIYYSNVPKDKDSGKYSQKAILDKILIKGIINIEEDSLASFDKTAFNDKNEVKKRGNGNYVSLSNSFSSSEDSSLLKSSQSKYTLKDFENDVIHGALTSIEKIKNNDFEIAPIQTVAGQYSDEHCKYCHYKDICYHAKTDINNICVDIEDHFGLSHKEVSDDDDDVEGEEE